MSCMPYLSENSKLSYASHGSQTQLWRFIKTLRMIPPWCQDDSERCQISYLKPRLCRARSEHPRVNLTCNVLEGSLLHNGILNLQYWFNILNYLRLYRVHLLLHGWAVLELDLRTVVHDLRRVWRRCDQNSQPFFKPTEIWNQTFLPRTACRFLLSPALRSEFS